MDNVFFQELELDLYKTKDFFECTISKEELSLIDEEYCIESVKDISDKIKNIITKFTNALYLYINSAKRIIELYNIKRDTKNNLKIIKRVIKKNPEIGKEKVSYRIFLNYNDNIDYYTKIINNVTFRVENIDNKWVTDLIDNYYKNIDGKNMIEEITINDAVDSINTTLKMINDDMDKTYKRIKNISDELNKKDSLNKKHINLFKRIIQNVQKSIQSKIFMLSINIDFVFNKIHSVIKSIIKKDTEKCKIKKVISRDKTAIKYSKKVDTVDILGYKIDLYETDKYIQSEFVMGGKHPTVYFGKNFRELPRANQVAILFHEYGHVINGHLGYVNYKNEYKLSKEFKRRTKKFFKTLGADFNSNKDKISDDNLLLYLLIELQADEFSSKIVGKKVIKKTLDHDYKEIVRDAKRLSDERKADLLLINKLRQEML